MRITDLFITFPIIVIGAVLGKLAGGGGAFLLALALGAIIWTTLARLVRGEFLTLREREFVDAAKVAGASSFRIMRKHMMPNAMGVIIVNTTLLTSTAVLLETALSYLGFGIKSPDVSLGTMISEYQSAFSTRPWLFWWPGLFIILIALSVNFIGDGLRDAFDPRQKRIPSAAQDGAGPVQHDGRRDRQPTRAPRDGTDDREVSRCAAVRPGAAAPALPCPARQRGEQRHVPGRRSAASRSSRRSSRWPAARSARARSVRRPGSLAVLAARRSRPLGAGAAQRVKRPYAVSRRRP